MTTQKRILHIIERLSKEACTTKQLALELYGTTDEHKRRIVQQDIQFLKKEYPNMIVSPFRGEYKFLQLPAFIQNVALVDGLELNELFDFMAVFDSSMLSLFEKNEPVLIGKLKQEVKSLYKIHESPLERLHSPFLEKIKKAIKYRQYVNIGYKEQTLEDLKLMQIHRIIYAKGNWYIAGYSANHERYNGYRFMRINFIDSLELLSATFKRNIQVEHFVENFQSLFSLYQTATFEVKLHVSSEVMRHFKAKQYLKSQKILQEDATGIVVTYQITENMEIIPLIKQWIPHVTVISPESLKKQLRDEVQEFLKSL